jgi:hypothetical protein
MRKRLGWGILGILPALLVGCNGDDGGSGGSATDSGSSTVDTASASTSASGTATTSGATDNSGTASMSASSGTESTSVGETEPGTTTMNASATAATDPTMGTTSDTGNTTGDDDLCEGGTLCGQPAVCCPAGNECVEDACLPECASQIRCGPMLEICCDDGQVCSGNACVAPGAPCVDSYDCSPGEYCEQTLQKCLPQPDPLTCELIPDFDKLDAVLEWKYDLEHIISIPVVTDLDGDGVPEVVVNATYKDNLTWEGGHVIALNGVTGAELWRVDHNPAMNKFGSHGRSTIAVGDVNGDGLPDVVYAGRPSGGRSRIYAVDHAGKFLWASRTANNQPFTTPVNNGAATLVNLDNDPEAEIIFGAAVIDNDGLGVWDQGGAGGNFGSPGSYPGGISAAVDLDGDNYPEIVSGRHAWKVDWKVVNNAPQVALTQFWIAAGNDGWPAIADLDANGTPEVILAASSTVRVLEGATGKLWCGIDPSGVACQNNDAARTPALAVRGGGLGGPPTVADFDGDGRPEVGIAGASAYAVYDFNRAGEQIIKPNADPNPASGAIFVKWFKATQDQSSNATGSSVFDFQGDGAAEVVYADECYMRVYSGTDGAVQLQIPNSNGTIHEYPLVVDVDGDGNSEILVVATNPANPCGGIPNYQTRRGLYVYGDANDAWVPTRKVWTQHTYHVTNATAQGNVPEKELDNWTTPGLNNYRQNSQGEGVFNAPDLTVDLAIGLDGCFAKLELRATVYNKGALGVPAGVEVSFYEGKDASGKLLGTLVTDKALLPGGSTKISLVIDAPVAPTDYFVEVDKASEGGGDVAECDEDNNTDGVDAAFCPMPA